MLEILLFKNLFPKNSSTLSATSLFNIFLESYCVRKTHPIFKSTFVIRCDHLDKIKAIAYLERKMIKHVIADSLESYIENYERSNGPIQLPKA